MAATRTLKNSYLSVMNCLRTASWKAPHQHYIHARGFAASKEDDNSVTDEPIKYSTSEAASWKARYTNSGGREGDVPEIQGYVVPGCFLVMFIYFGFLREENDIDELMYKPLDDYMPGISKTVFK